MSDIVERLRQGVDTNEPPDKTDRVMAEAADEIERLHAVVVGSDREIKASHADADRLRAEIERLTAALRWSTSHDRQ